MKVLEQHTLYDVRALEIARNHPDRTFAPNIDQGGSVHLNVLAPGARAGNHYHEKLQEFFVNAGPGTLLLHLQDPETGSVEVVEMMPASLSEVRAYHPKPGTPHIVENSNQHPVTLIIIVNQDRPEDVHRAKMYSALGICADIPGFSTEDYLKSKRKGLIQQDPGADVSPGSNHITGGRAD